MKAITAVALVMLAVAQTSLACNCPCDPNNHNPNPPPPPNNGPKRGNLIFRDDFNSFDQNNWRHVVSAYGGHNGEFQVYTNDQKNVYAKNGYLYLRPTLTIDDPRFDEHSLHHGRMNLKELYGVCTNDANWGCQREGKYGILPTIMSGRINSVKTMKFGTVEIRAKIPQGDWIWPAIWMMPKYSRYGGWPRSGEIDIMESRGNPGHQGVGEVSSTLHWGPSPQQNKFMLTTGQKHSGNWHNDFHTWRLEWTPEHIITYIDNQQIMKVDPGPRGGSMWNMGGFGGHNIWGSGGKMTPFDQEFYMILNVAVGGTNGFFADGNGYGRARKPWNNHGGNAAQDFWNARGDWLPSWKGEETALIIDWVEFRSL